jgi:hypothetical protein
MIVVDNDLVILIFDKDMIQHVWSVESSDYNVFVVIDSSTHRHMVIGDQ